MTSPSYSRFAARDRAGREHQALLALEQAGLEIAPRPVLLDPDRDLQPIVVRFARCLYDVPRGLDERLAARPTGWQAAIQANYDRYLAQALGALSRP